MEAHMATPLPGWRFWLAWVLATLVGGVVFLILMAPLSLGMVAALGFFGLTGQSPVPSDLAGMFVGLLVNVFPFVLMGAVFGIAQWVVLRRVLPGTGGWVLANIIGYPLAFAIQRLIPGGTMPILGGVSMFLLFGITLGICEWLVLRRRVPHAEIWVAISIAGWALAFLLIGALEVSGLYVEPFDLVAALLVPTTVSGAGIVWLLRREPPKIQLAEV